MRQAPYRLVYAPAVLSHLGAIAKRHHGLIKRTIEERLRFEPARRTRHRKPLEELPGSLESTWELRLGPANCFRVFYEPKPGERTVWILAIGVKDGNRLLIAGKEY